jgi:hypothetical protein
MNVALCRRPRLRQQPPAWVRSPKYKIKDNAKIKRRAEAGHLAKSPLGEAFEVSEQLFLLALGEPLGQLFLRDDLFARVEGGEVSFLV